MSDLKETLQQTISYRGCAEPHIIRIKLRWHQHKATFQIENKLFSQHKRTKEECKTQITFAFI